MAPISLKDIPVQDNEKPLAALAKVDLVANNQNKMPVACVILPTYNEIENVTQVIPAVFQQTAKISGSHPEL